MPEPLFSEEADAALTELEHDSGRVEVLRATVTVIAAIGDDPGAAEVRRRSYRVVDDRICFGVPYRTYDENWLVLWELIDGEPLVIYIGPDLQ